MTTRAYILQEDESERIIMQRKKLFADIVRKIGTHDLSEEVAIKLLGFIQKIRPECHGRGSRGTLDRITKRVDEDKELDVVFELLVFVCDQYTHRISFDKRLIDDFKDHDKNVNRLKLEISNKSRQLTRMATLLRNAKDAADISEYHRSILFEERDDLIKPSLYKELGEYEWIVEEIEVNEDMPSFINRYEVEELASQVDKMVSKIKAWYAYGLEVILTDDGDTAQGRGAPKLKTEVLENRLMSVLTALGLKAEHAANYTRKIIATCGVEKPPSANSISSRWSTNKKAAKI